MIFSKNLKDHMKRNGLSLKDLSVALEVSPSTIHGWLNGVPPRNILILHKLAGTMDLSIEELCFDIKKNPKIDTGHLETNLIISIGDESFKLILKKHHSK